MEMVLKLNLAWLLSSQKVHQGTAHVEMLPEPPEFKPEALNHHLLSNLQLFPSNQKPPPSHKTGYNHGQIFSQLLNEYFAEDQQQNI